MAGKKEYELAVKIAGMVDASLGQSCSLTKKQLKALAKEAADTSQKSVSFFGAMETMGPGIDAAWEGAKKAVVTTAEAMAAAAATIGVVGGLAIKAGSDFESAFAGVRKTVDATEEQYAQLEAGLRNMAKNKPQTAVELAEIAEAAGQLGIHVENIQDFTNVMADLKVATNLGDEGAPQFAKFANIVGMSQDKFGNLGSTVVALGNNMATTEADIVSMAMRLAGAGKQVNMSEADIMGLAAALSSVGIEAEAGGSAMSKVMVNMQLAVETGASAWDELDASLARTGHTREQAESAVAAGGKELTNFATAVGWNAKQLKASVKQAQESAGSLQDFADVAGMSSEEFAKAFEGNAAGAIAAFVSGLNDTERLGQSAIVTLDNMDITEVRLRDTLLRAANASGLFSDALELANTSFNDNTALAKEAEQRYATFESRMEMLKNRITDVGISLYQDFRDPLSDCLDLALDFTDSSDLFDNSFIEEMARNFQKSLPTIVRHLGEAREAIMDFADPLLKVGGWMAANPDVIAGGLAAIGTTITSLKVVKTVTDTASAMNALKTAMMGNPVIAAIGITAMAGGAIVGIATKVKIANAELKKQNLAQHFGSISLSLGELEDAATQIIDNGSLSKLSVVMDEFGKVEALAKSLSDSQDELNKLNWKIGMGLELSETEKDTYGAQIEAFVQDAVSLAEQQQYAMNVSLQLLTKDDDTGNEIINQFNSFYGSLNEELRSLGDQLGEAYAEGMKDGVLSLDEVEAIQELQQKMANITAKLSSSQFEAKLETLGVKYSGGQLDAESFQNLQAEIQTQIDEASGNLQESLTMNIAGAKLQLDEGAIDMGQYERMVNEFKTNYQDQMNEINSKAFQFTMGSVDTQYSEVTEQLDDFVNYIGSYLNESMNQDRTGWLTNTSEQYIKAIQSIKESPEISEATRAAVEEILEGIQPQIEDWEALSESYKQQGKKVPESIQAGLNDAALLKAILGDEGEITRLMDEYLESSPESVALLGQAKQLGNWIPENISEGIESGKGSIDAGVDSLYEYARSKLQSKFSQIEVNAGINVSVSGTGKGDAKGSIQAHAEGGIFDTPHFGLFAEAGPEAFIPLDGSKNAVSIWQRAGEALGVMGGGAALNQYEGNTEENISSKIVYSPVYQIYGGDERTIRKTQEDDYERFKQHIFRFQKDQRRLAF